MEGSLKCCGSGTWEVAPSSPDEGGGGGEGKLRIARALSVMTVSAVRFLAVSGGWKEAERG
jgi:hypothetical protein